jgi:hypothetical protein
MAETAVVVLAPAGLDEQAQIDARARNLRMLAMVLWFAALTLIATTLLIWIGRGFPRSPVAYARGPLGTSAIALTGLVYSSVAVFLLYRLPRNPIGWIFLVIGLAMAVVMPINLALSDALRSFRPVPQAGLWLAWGLTSVQIPASGALLVVVLLLFPSGRPDWRYFRLAALTAFVGCVLMTIGSLLEPDGLLWYPTLPNPTAAPAEWLPALLGARVVGMICLVVSLVFAAGRLYLRWRDGKHYQRRQLAWILVGAIAMVSTLAPLFAIRYALGASDELGEQIVFVAAVGGVLFPITVTVAALRERLFGMEGIVARTLVYVPLMAILGGLYASSVMVLQKVFVAFTGNPSDAAVVVATLLMAGALTPVRRSLEGLVERNTRGRAVAAVVSDVPAGMNQEAILARLVELERRLAELGEPPLEPPLPMASVALDALHLPIPGEGGLPEPILPPASTSARRARQRDLMETTGD